MNSSVNDSLLERDHQTYCCNLSCLGFFLLILFTFVLSVILILLIVVLVSIFVGYPNLAQKTMDASQIQVLALNMQLGKNNEVLLTETMVFSNTGAFPSTISQMTAQVSYKDQPLGQLQLPAVKLSKGTTTINLVTVLTVTDSGLFREFNAQLLLGNTATMRLKGKASVKSDLGITLTTSVNFDKEVSVQGAVLQNMTITELEPISGTSSILNATGHVSFINPGTITFSLSNVVFEIRSVSGVVIGKSMISDFNLTAGPNRFAFTTYMNSSGTQSTINQFISTWLTGESQTVFMGGPQPSPDQPEWIYNLVANQTVTVLGSTNPLIIKAWINQTSMVTLPPYVYQTSYNPSLLFAKQSNLSFSVYLSQPVGTTNEYDDNYCAGGVSFPNIVYPDSFIVPPKSFLTLLVPTRIPLDSNFRCTLERTQSSYCLLSHVGLPFRQMVTVVGTMDLLLEDFPISVTYRQENIVLELDVANYTLNVCNQLPYRPCYAPVGQPCNFPS